MTVCSKCFWISRLKYPWFLVFSNQRIAITKSQWTHCSNNWPIYPILSNIRISLQNSKQSLLELSRELILHALCNPWSSSSKRLINLMEFSLFSKGHFYIFLKNWEGGGSATRPYIIMWEKNHRTCGIYMNNDWLYKCYKAYTIKFKRQKKRNKENIERRKKLPKN